MDCLQPDDENQMKRFGLNEFEFRMLSTRFVKALEIKRKSHKS